MQNQKQMLRNLQIIFVSILLSFAGVSALGQSQLNILFIFADDWGYGDLGCHGHTYVKTPNIDRLVEEGVDSTNLTVASAICSLSRTGVLTGCFPARVNVTGHCHTTRYNEMQNQGSWDITFNVNLDSPADARFTREFRFSPNI